MSRLEELIQEYCPGGVKFDKLVNISNILYGYPCDASKFNDNRTGMPLIRIRDVLAGTSNTYTTEEISEYYIIRKGDLLVGMDGNFHVGNWKDNDGYLCQRVCKICSKDEKVILNRFLSHYLPPIMKQIEANKLSGTVKHLLAKDINAITIPVPPLPVQEEIVRILDNFTELTAELQKMLDAELQARKKQYEYYRDDLLIFDSAIKKVRLGDICSVITKGTTPKSYTKTGIAFVKTEAFDGTRIVPERLSYVDEETHTTFLRRSILEENDILVTIAGATIGKCAMVPKEILPANTNQALAIIRLAKGNSPKYVMYLLQSDLMKQYMQKNIKGSAQPNLNLKQLNDFIIPLPPLSVQERLVHILDNFEAICSDLNIGLPAEIQARQKQYEYYRDKLLTFPPLS